MIHMMTVNKRVGPDTAELHILKDLDLTVHSGEIVAMAGPSGSGKTTVLALLAGWADPDSGHVTIIDHTIHRAKRPWSDVAVIPQSLGLLPELTIGENIALPTSTARTATSTALGFVTEQLGIGHLTGRFPDEISLGEQQRAAIARAAIVQPKVLLADEPIAHQNQQRAHDVMSVIHQLACNGAAVLIATHNELAFEYSHRILQLTGGALRSHQAPTTSPDAG
jgi:putative ABC transport system ATP-binding protein